MTNPGFALPRPADRPLRVLCLGAHSDDIEIGCGGTMLKLQQTGEVAVHWVVFGASPTRADEARVSSDRFLADVTERTVEVHDYPDGFFPDEWAAIKRRFEALKTSIDPDIVFTHHRDDLHQDHRLVGELTWNTFRDHLILEYEIPKYDGDLGQPNLFVHLTEDLCETKYQITHDSFVSQHDKHWFTRDTFFALMRLRGVESASPTRYAEAFYSRKGVIR
jgi:LmbE family N-acetylglucosaminyl deacetylase